MQKEWISALMIPLLLLSGCGEREARLQKGFQDFRRSVAQAAAVTARVELRADPEGEEQTYALAMTASASETRLEVEAPELLAGTSAVVSADMASVAYGDVVLAVPPVSGDGLTPVSALPVILRAIREDYTELVWWDDGYIAARFTVGEAAAATIWVDPDTLALKWAEISEDGAAVIHCDFTEWGIT